MDITATILTKNSEATLRATLESLFAFSEVLILDTGSIDQTLEFAKKFNNVRIYHSPFLGFGPTHNAASEQAKNDWIFSIDSDEVLSPELISEIKNLKLDPEAIYSIRRENYFNGKKITCCSGWHPDRVIRLYNRKKTRFTEAKVHETVKSEGMKIIFLKSPLLHYPYREISHFLTKMQTYTTLFAEQEKGKRKASFSKAFFHAFFAFFKSYILKRGFLAGKEGFIISAYQSQTAFYKYLKLLEKCR